MDDEAPDSILEVTARALTYYLDVSADCTRRITAVDGALKAIITRMQVADMTNRSSKDLAEQCVKVHQGGAFVVSQWPELSCEYGVWVCTCVPVW